MRKLVLGLVAGTALALGSAANATITLNTCDPSLTLCAVDNSQAPAQSTVAFSDFIPAGGFGYFIDFTNTLAGNYWISLETSTPGLLFNTLTITPIAGSGSITYLGGPTPSITLLPGSLGVGSYHFAFTGNSPAPNGGVGGGSITFRLAVPEPGTWAMMLLGFGGIGLAMRRRRRPMLAQIA